MISMTNSRVSLDPMPLVSIICNTYNHENFISDAINGFLMQQTNFPIEILIHDDSSNDGTPDIISVYQKQHPNMIFPIYQEENQYSKGHKITLEYQFPRARGKYIALCEGDDYWTDPNKLQNQVDFLEENPDFSICFHKVKILKNRRLKNDYLTHVPKEVTTIEDIAVRNYIHTPSVVFRNRLISELPGWYFNSPVGDHPLHILNAQYGKIKYIDKAMAVYRIHKGGTWSQIDNNNIEKQINWIRMQENMADYFSGSVRGNH